MKIWLTAGAASIVLMTGLAVPAFADESQTYGYDALQRLISVKYSGTINAGQAHSLCYDPAGNRSRYRSSSTGVVATCAVAGAATSGGAGTGEPELLPAQDDPGGGPPGGDPPAEDVYPTTTEDLPEEATLPDVPPVEASGPQGDGPELPPDPPPGGDEPPADPPPEGEGSGR